MAFLYFPTKWKPTNIPTAFNEFHHRTFWHFVSHIKCPNLSGQLKTFRMIVNIFYANVYSVRQKDKFISSTQKASRDCFNQLSLGLFYTVFFPPPPKLKKKKCSTTSQIPYRCNSNRMLECVRIFLYSQEGGGHNECLQHNPSFSHLLSYSIYGPLVSNINKPSNVHFTAKNRCWERRKKSLRIEFLAHHRDFFDKRL